MMTLKIITPLGCPVEAEVEKVFLPGGAGAFEVLQGHAPLVSTLEKGVVRYGVDEELQEYAVKGGFVKVEDNTITVCTEE
ncbi:MAG: F0F1 ATP synthase subunit epsilon [Bacteroidales bacterium]|nr:F0F1 ATP synthase subunit epsilon [Bacteroidales bacterium]